MSGEDIRLLHAVLNFHLPPPSDQLPVSGPGEFDFGPRTEAKVKEFQRLNRIDIGTPDFMDGVVGPHTLAVLQSGAKVVFRLGIDPEIKPQPLPLPFPQPIPIPPLRMPIVPPPAPQPPFIPAPRLHLDNVQIQAGASRSFITTRDSSSSLFSQVQFTFLWRRDGPHTEFSFGATNAFGLNTLKDGSDIQLFGQIARAQIPIFGNLTVSFFGQIAVQNLLMLKPFRPVIGLGAGLQLQWEFIKDRFSIGAQGMPFLNFLVEKDELKVLTGAQGQGFLILQFDAGPR